MRAARGRCHWKHAPLAADGSDLRVCLNMMPSWLNNFLKSRVLSEALTTPISRNICFVQQRRWVARRCLHFVSSQHHEWPWASRWEWVKIAFLSFCFLFALTQVWLDQSFRGTILHKGTVTWNRLVTGTTAPINLSFQQIGKAKELDVCIWVVEMTEVS